MKLLLTGAPGVGKTTIVQHISSTLPEGQVAGFYTEELREQGRRVGFDLVSVPGGERAALSRVHTSVAGPRVGQYTVCTKEFETLAVRCLAKDNLAGCRVVVIDEVGKMESFSHRFISLVRDVFSDAGEMHILATVPLSGKGRVLPIVQELLDREDTELITVTRENRDRLRGELVKRLSSGS